MLLPAAEPDVIVVGAGLFGAMLAHRLTVRGARVLVLEAEDVGARAARRRLMIDPGLFSGAPVVDRAHASRAVLGILEAQAPHLVRRTEIFASTDGGSAMRAALATLRVHDLHAPGFHAGAARAQVSELSLRAPLRLEAHLLDEARLALAHALVASARGAEVRTGVRVESVRAEGERLVVRAAGQRHLARTVVLTAGGDLSALVNERASLTPAEPLLFELELFLSRQLTERVFVDRRGAQSLEHLPHLDRSLVRLTSPTPIDVDAALDHLFTCVPRGPVEVFDLRRASRHVGPVKITRGELPGLHTLTGNDLATGHREVQRLAQALAGGTASTGDDTRLEEGEFEVTPAVERTRLGAEILHALGARHGERASAIVERVMAAPREGSLVCPCSTVTEAELRYAHRDEFALDLDALKRRTELGVGACRGVRCAHRAAAIVAEEQVVDTPDAEVRGGTRALLAARFLSARRRSTVIEPARAAILDELSRSMSAAAGLDEEPA